MRLRRLMMMSLSRKELDELDTPNPVTGEVFEVLGTGPWYRDAGGYYWMCECGHKEYLRVYSCGSCRRRNPYAD